MNDYDKIFKELQEKYTIEEIAEGYMIPKTRTPEEKEKADQAFLKIRLEMRNNRTPKQILLSEMMLLKIKIEDYLKKDTYLDTFSFAHVLEAYFHILQKTKKDIAKDIDIPIAQLNRIIKNEELPNLGLMYRLEKHTDGIVPVLYWWKIVARETEYNIRQEVKKLEACKNVRNYLGLL